MGYMWARMAIKATTVDPDNTVSFYAGKKATASFYMAKLLPQVNALALSIKSGADSLMNFPEEAF